MSRRTLLSSILAALIIGGILYLVTRNGVDVSSGKDVAEKDRLEKAAPGELPGEESSVFLLQGSTVPEGRRRSDDRTTPCVMRTPST